jgi:hypothetical protein
VPADTCQIAIAFRPRDSAASISSRNGSHALALGDRPGSASGSVDTPGKVAGFDPESVDTSMAGFDLGSVDTSPEVAGFDSRGRPPRPRTATPADLR